MTTTPSPYLGIVNDGEGGRYLAPWYVRGWTAQNPELILDVNPFQTQTSAPLDLSFTVITRRYFDGDFDPLGGFLTFYPSDAFTVTDTDPVTGLEDATYYVPQRLLGTETWPAVDAGVSPWAFSMEGSGRIYIWQGLLVAKLFATDNPNLLTDSGQPLTYHVIEHFLGGKEYDITVPTSTDGTPVQLSDCIIPNTVDSAPYSPTWPMSMSLEDFGQQVTAINLGVTSAPELPVQTIASSATNYVTADITATSVGTGQTVDPETDTIFFAFMQGNATPGDSDWHAGAWVMGGPPYYANILVGPDNDGIVLSRGTYQIYVKMVDYPQTFVVLVGLLYIS